MKKILTNKWLKVSPSCFGDFAGEAPCFGIVDYFEGKSYRIGRFNSEKKPDGLNATIRPGESSFAKYKNGQALYPLINILSTGEEIELILGKNEKTDRRLVLETRTGNFAVRQYDNNNNRVGIHVTYDVVNAAFVFETYRNGNLANRQKVSKRFVVEKPITGEKRLDYPFIIDADKCVYSNEDGFAGCCLKTNEDNRVGMATWSDGSYCITPWSKDGNHIGWHLYQFDGYYDFCYLNNSAHCGIVVRVYEKDGVICVTRRDGEVDDNLKEGSILEIHNDFIYYYNSIDGLKEGDPMVRIRGFEEISFSKCHQSGNQLFTDYTYAEPVPEVEVKKKEEESVDKNDPEYQMMHLIGQEDAKKEFTRIRAYIQKNDVSTIYKNIVFFGENGVGKSTVGRLIAKVLYKYKAIRHDGYIEGSGKDLYNNFTGETTSNLSNLVKSGSGGVILIDDLHYLDAMNASNIKEGIPALAKLMAEDPQTVFILCDNKYNMTQILENYHDELADKLRFRVNFKDFTREELQEIIKLRLENKGYKIEEDALNKLLDVVFLSKSYGNNINASAALSILEEIIIFQNVRTELVDDKTINLDDVNVYIAENDIAFIDQKTGGQSDARKKLDELIGLENIKETVDDLIAYFSINRGKKVDFHMCFSGNPGTGKTEVARIMGKLLRQEGILPTAKFLEVTRKDLIGQYVGQTAIITRDIIDKAMGGVLYIDEAYSLAYGTDLHGGGKDFGPECIAELLKAMEDRRGEFCVILAGYTSEMKKLFDINPGFKSRIKFDLEFPDYSDEELEKIARLFLKKENAVMSDEDIKFLVKIVSIQRKKPNFANVRTLREAISKIQIKHARRVREDPNLDQHELTYEDIVGAFSKEEIDEAINDNKELVVPKLNPKELVELYKDYKPVAFEQSRDFLPESILALKMSGEKSGEGTGFIISKDGYFLTCAHCVNGATEITARRRLIHHGRHIDINYNATIISVDKQADVALCKLEADGEEFDYLNLAGRNVELPHLSKVYLLGYPFGASRFDELSINEGKIASYQKDMHGAPGQINLDIQAKGGNSGSPIIDAETSEVLGVFCGSALSFGANLTEEINYCRPIDYVWDMLEKEYKEKK